ncbi:hypothetical protein FHU41_002281 [Psychromicrobium silvestre]|uniref:Aminoglycoside phosphotransferase domain-containing protein n=1 Tax=Psychromicrobium silvestre TaxID=1645614 RepID=A0A7Y9LUW1_9MICC|nr:phosphotransferase [Psychromicrobium silvestre]NYE96031.1 hypothetical protein [Psychromicrobium silvestre]
MSSPLETWATAEWLAEAEAWVVDSLAALGIAVRGPLAEHKTRFWATVRYVATDRGRFWFKENYPGARNEARLLLRIAELAPESVVQPIAIEESHGWLLSPDYGQTLISLGEQKSLARLPEALRDYALLQQKLLGQELPAPKRAPAQAVEYFSAAVRSLQELPAEHPLRFTTPEAEAAQGNLPTVERAADRLNASDIPLSLDHNDFHPNNIFLPRPGEKVGRLLDFGDAVVAHPFCSLGRPIREYGESLNITPYLECWLSYAPLPELRQDLDAALVLSRLNQFDTWQRMLDQVAAEEMGRFADSIKSLLLEP